MKRFWFVSVMLALTSSSAYAQFFTSGCRPNTSCTLQKVTFAPVTTSSYEACFSTSSGPAFGFGIGSTASTFALSYDTGSATCPRAGFANELARWNASTLILTSYLPILFDPSITATTPTGMRLTSAGLLQSEAVYNKLWYKDSIDNNVSDLGSGPHPVLDNAVVSARVGAAQTACPLMSGTFPDAATGAAVTNTCTAVAAATSSVGSTTGRYYRMSTTLGVANSTDTVSTPVFARPVQGLRHCTAVLMPATITTMRVWVGLFTALPGSSDGPTTSNFGFRYSTNASDTTWQLCSADGTTQSCTNTTVAVTGGVEYTLCADYRKTSAAIYSYITTQASSAPTFTAKSTNLPASTTSLLYAHSVEALAASARSFGLSSYSVEQR